MFQSRQISCALFLSISSCLCSGWPEEASAQNVVQPADSKKGADKVESGAKSPEEAFTAYQKAIEKDDWKTAFQFQTEASRDYMVGGLLLACQFGVLEDAGKKLASESADEAKLKDLVSKIMKAPRKEQAKHAGEVAALVAKKPEFMSRATALFKAQKKEAWIVGIGMAKLVGLKVKDDRATARMEIRLETGAGSEPMGFRRIDGRWYVDYSDE